MGWGKCIVNRELCRKSFEFVFIFINPVKCFSVSCLYLMNSRSVIKSNGSYQDI